MQYRDLFIPKPESLLSEPRHRVVARLAGPDEAAAALGALIDAGIPSDELFVVCGEEGARRLDPTGRYHGVKGRLVRAAQTIFSAGGEIAEDAAHLEAGGGLVIAPAHDPDERKIATEVLRDHGGTGMRYFGTTTWEEIG
jgi:hypothetical protein